MSHDTDELSPPSEPDGQVPRQARERQLRPVWVGLAVFSLVALAVIALAFSLGKPPPAPAPSASSAPSPSVTIAPSPSAQILATTTPAHTMPAAMGAQKSWILLPPMPANATQADRGAQIYRLVCSTCHGSAGEGLSYGPWVKTSAENCWQANCHGKGHPHDGFELPRYIPPVVGPNTVQKFQNALALYQFVRATMPMQAPGTMLDEEYWEVIAFLVRANGADPTTTPLDPQRAAEVPLR
jgi:mono/diheme cytochrome c family protein